MADDNPLVEAYLESLWAERGLSDNSLEAYRRDLAQFADWHGGALDGVDAARISAWMGHRYDCRFAPRSTARALSCLRGFYRWLVREGRMEQDPTARTASPAMGRSLPRSLSEDDVERLLAAPDLRGGGVLALRDKAMLECMYGCGLRVSELVSLPLAACNLRQGALRIFGKGGRERLVPLGQAASRWIERFLRQGRPALLNGKSSEAVFVSRLGAQMTRHNFWHRLAALSQRAGIKAHISPHILRHAFATHLLNHGADLRSVQLLLGHRSLSSTQIYTHIAQARLAALHAAHHPRG